MTNESSKLTNEVQNQVMLREKGDPSGIVQEKNTIDNIIKCYVYQPKSVWEDDMH